MTARKKKKLSSSERAAVATRLRRVVEETGTQAEAAAIAGVSLRSMKRFLAGEIAPSFEAVRNLAVARGWNADWILTGQGQERRVSLKDSPEAQAEVLAMTQRAMGGPAALEVLLQLMHAGLFAIYEEEGFPLEERDEQEVLEIARATARFLANFPRERWPELVPVILESHRVALAHAKKRS